MALNNQWAEEMFPSASSAERLLILHEDELGDTKIGRCTAGGPLRLDLRSATVLSAARKNQLMSAGLNRYVPFSTVGQMGATPYLFRSGFNAGIAFAEDGRPKN